jgi:hypothetical protein
MASNWVTEKKLRAYRRVVDAHKMKLIEEFGLEVQKYWQK